jgi:hypothetical protein
MRETPLPEEFCVSLSDVHEKGLLEAQDIIAARERRLVARWIRVTIAGKPPFPSLFDHLTPHLPSQGLYAEAEYIWSTQIR